MAGIARVSAAIAGALILARSVRGADADQPERHRLQADGLDAAAARRSPIGAAAPEVYRFVAQLPASAVLLELPLGEPAFDVRYMFYSTLHWRRLVNGYSGGVPASYDMLTESLKDVASRPDRAWQAIADSAATHVDRPRRRRTPNGGGRRSATGCVSHGAREVAAFGIGSRLSTSASP